VTAPVAPLLTVRQRRILDFIRSHVTEHGYCPTYDEIAAACGLQSKSAVMYQLGQLQQAGWIRRSPNRVRAIQILNPADGTDT
jgi:repressor LexA